MFSPHRHVTSLTNLKPLPISAADSGTSSFPISDLHGEEVRQSTGVGDLHDDGISHQYRLRMTIASTTDHITGV